MILSTVHNHLSSFRNPKLFLHLELASFLTLWRRILTQPQLTASMNAHLPHGSRTILCLLHRYHASRKIRRVKQFLGKSTSSCANDTTHTWKQTQMVQSMSRKWQLLHITLKTLMTSELFDYETAPLFLITNYKVYTSHSSKETFKLVKNK